MLTHPLIDRIEFLPETTPGGERAHVEFPHLSGSQLSALTRCGLAYYFSRKLKIKEPLNTATLKGSAFHEGIGAYMQLTRDGVDAQEALAQATSIAAAYIETALGVGADLSEYPIIVDYGHRWPKGPATPPKASFWMRSQPSNML